MGTKPETALQAESTERAEAGDVEVCGLPGEL